jgi:hypothetical protein
MVFDQAHQIQSQTHTRMTSPASQPHNSATVANSEENSQLLEIRKVIPRENRISKISFDQFKYRQRFYTKQEPNKIYTPNNKKKYSRIFSSIVSKKQYDPSTMKDYNLEEQLSTGPPKLADY